MALLLPFTWKNVESSCFTVRNLRRFWRRKVFASLQRSGRKLHRRFADVATSGEKAHAFHFYIDRSVFVSIMFHPTVRTPPLPFSQLQIFLDVSALVTSLRGREESSHFLQFSPNLLGLVFQLIDRPTYPRIVCRFSSQLNPSLQAQVFDTHY